MIETTPLSLVDGDCVGKLKCVRMSQFTQNRILVVLKEADVKTLPKAGQGELVQG